VIIEQTYYDYGFCLLQLLQRKPALCRRLQIELQDFIPLWITSLIDIGLLYLLLPVDLILVLFIRPSPVNDIRFYVRLNLGIIFNVAWVSVLQTLLCIIIIKFIPAWCHVLGGQRRVALPLEFFPLSILSFQFYLVHVVEEILPHRHVLSLDYVHVNFAFVN